MTGRLKNRTKASISYLICRFSQFFISPLFTETATDRELNAVNSEHDKNVFSDMWRLDQLDKHMSDAGHAYHKFGTGTYTNMVKFFN